ncbi:MAG: hypothetical protein KQA36_00515 [Candidatus Aenigmarchaeota archaeon]|nr:hypothetical protein [Candidatus Aenigmarchaeota archaeon]
MKKIFELFLGLLLISSIAIADNIPYVASKWEVVNNQIVTETFSDIHGTEVRVCALVCDPDDVANLNNAIVKARVFYPNGTSFILKALGQTTTGECIKENPNTAKCRIYTTTFTIYPENPIGYYTTIVFVEYSSTQLNATQSIIKGADRLINNQNSDGGWGWPKGSPSCTNLAGVTSMGLYYAYKITEDEDYMQAMEKSLQYIKTHAPTYNSACAETGLTCYSPGTESNSGCDSNKDILFLAHLALLKNDDMIANLAKQRYEGKRNCFNPTDPIKGARAIANEIFNLRQSQGINAVALWDVGDWIVALYKLSEYPGIDYRLEADAMAELMKEKIGGGYFDINDNTITYYYLGLVGIIEAMQTTGKYTDLVNLAKEKLINGQREEGWWPTDESNPNTPDAQTTAYAKMVLEMLGEDEKAAKAATWLIVNQTSEGWFDIEEYDEVTSEGVWAIARDVSKQNRFKHLGADFKALREKVEDMQNKINTIEQKIEKIEDYNKEIDEWKTKIDREVQGIWAKLEIIQKFIQKVLSCSMATFNPFYQCLSEQQPEPWEEHCGNGICEWEKGETPTSCKADCEPEVTHDGTTELLVAQSWRVTCPFNFTLNSTLYIVDHCRAELWRNTWKISERRMNPGEAWQVNRNAGYFIKLYANGTLTS